MPIYEYKCLECNEEYEKFVSSINQEKEIKCPKCNSEKKIRKISKFLSNNLSGKTTQTKSSMRNYFRCG